MWFVWIGNFVVSLVSFLVSKISLKSLKMAAIIPLSVVYIGLMVTSFGLFVTAMIYIVNSAYDLINAINFQNSSSGVLSVFKCFFYLLDSLGIADALKTGISLLVSNILALVTLKAAMAGKKMVQDIIDIFNKTLS